ncbi:MAG: hypothetical protein ACTSWR_04060 [Candidatus Helarchaeota archaeon]
MDRRILVMDFKYQKEENQRWEVMETNVQKSMVEILRKLGQFAQELEFIKKNLKLDHWNTIIKQLDNIVKYIRLIATGQTFAEGMNQFEAEVMNNINLWNELSQLKQLVYSNIVPNEEELFELPAGTTSVTISKQYAVNTVDVIVNGQEWRQGLDYQLDLNNYKNVYFLRNIEEDSWCYVRYKVKY